MLDHVALDPAPPAALDQERLGLQAPIAVRALAGEAELDRLAEHEAAQRFRRHGLGRPSPGLRIRIDGARRERPDQAQLLPSSSATVSPSRMRVTVRVGPGSSPGHRLCFPGGVGRAPP